MERRKPLRLAPASPRPGGRESRGLAGAFGVLVLGVAVATTRLGADRLRSAAPSEQIAEEIVARGLDAGFDGEPVREGLRGLRRRVGARPLDSRTRVLYSAVLLEIGGPGKASQAAAFHARRAASLAPVTVPVVRAAALVLAQCDDAGGATDLTRAMFGYDPRSASRLLGMLEPFLAPELLEDTVPEDPDAWLAWSDHLSRSGHTTESEEWLARGRLRFPDHLPIRAALASRAVSRGDWKALEELLPLEETLPSSPAAARLFAYRARLRAERGDAPGARADAARAEAQDGTAVLLVVADALAAAGDFDGARSRYSGALYRLPSGEDARASRIALLLKLARLEERRGRLGEALRRFRAVLEIDPEHAESKRRVAAITGMAR